MAEAQAVATILIRAQIEPGQRYELVQMCKSWLSDQLPSACLERRFYEDVMAPTHILLAEDWSHDEAMYSYLSSEQFRAVVGAVKVLGKLINLCIAQVRVVEAG